MAGVQEIRALLEMLAREDEPAAPATPQQDSGEGVEEAATPGQAGAAAEDGAEPAAVEASSGAAGKGEAEGDRPPTGSGSASKVDGQARAERDAILVFKVLRVACETQVAKLVEPSLGCIQRMVAHGYLRGEMEATTLDQALALHVLGLRPRCKRWWSCLTAALC
jgi:hypothetical protein